MVFLGLDTKLLNKSVVNGCVMSACARDAFQHTQVPEQGPWFAVCTVVARGRTSPAKHASMLTGIIVHVCMHMCVHARTHRAY